MTSGMPSEEGTVRIELHNADEARLRSIGLYLDEPRMTDVVRRLMDYFINEEIGGDMRKLTVLNQYGITRYQSG